MVSMCAQERIREEILLKSLTILPQCDMQAVTAGARISARGHSQGLRWAHTYVYVWPRYRKVPGLAWFAKRYSLQTNMNFPIKN